VGVNHTKSALKSARFLTSNFRSFSPFLKPKVKAGEGSSCFFYTRGMRKFNRELAFTTLHLTYRKPML
jgi:hypothetical protein